MKGEGEIGWRVKERVNGERKVRISGVGRLIRVCGGDRRPFLCV